MLTIKEKVKISQVWEDWEPNSYIQDRVSAFYHSKQYDRLICLFILNTSGQLPDVPTPDIAEFLKRKIVLNIRATQ